MTELCNRDAEIIVLRLIADNNELMGKALGRLKPSDFAEYKHQEIYKAEVKLFSEDKEIDIVSMANYFESAGLMERIDTKFIMDVLGAYAFKADFERSVETVLMYSQRRKTISLLDAARIAAEDMAQDIATTQDTIVDELGRIKSATTKQEKSFTDVVLNVFSEIVEGTDAGLPTGYGELDNLLKGFSKGNLVVLAARPGMGKTALALNIGANVCKAGKSVLFMSYEMSSEELVHRLITMESGISRDMQERQRELDKALDNPKSMYASMSESEKDKLRQQSERVWFRLQAGAEVLGKWAMSVEDGARATPQVIASKAKIWKHKHGLDLIIVDYLQLMTFPGFKPGDKVAEVSAITRYLKQLAKALEVPILLLSQLNRGVEARGDKRPMLADLRDSGSIEQDADKVLMLYRAKYYEPELDDDSTEVIINKHRSGAVGTVRLKFNAPVSRFEDFNGMGAPASKAETKEARSIFGDE